MRLLFTRVAVALLPAFSLFAVPARVLAQQGGRLSGVVRIRASGQPVAGATVSIEGLGIVAQTDSLGRYALLRVPAGPQVVGARRVGYAPARTPFTMPAGRDATLDLAIATSALRLDQLIVTADRTGRARGELGSASVIDRNAIANQIAASLQGILELVPGVILNAPGLDGPSQFSLRALGTPSTGGTGGTAGTSAADIAASGTLIVLDGVPLSNNANLQTVGARGEIVSTASTAGGGVDLRRIPAAVLERVEVIRGIPSARWGDLTQGAVIVDTRAAATSPELAGRLDPRTTEGNIVGGRSYANDRQAFTLTANLAQTASARTLSSAATTRGAGQLAHRLQLGNISDQRARPDGRASSARIVFDTRLDWWQLKFSAPERPDLQVGRNSFQDDHGIRLAERARLALWGGLLEWTAAIDGQSQSTRESQILARPTTPFTDRLTEGRSNGRYVEGNYAASYAIEGAPRLFYSRLEFDRTATGGSVAGTSALAQLRAGAEVRREWNVGEGYLFAIDRPPQASPFNGTAGFDRPRDFRTIPVMASSAVYADTRLAARIRGMVAEIQPGLRLEALHERGPLSGVRSGMLQPRLNAQLAVRPWIRVRGGLGTVSKAPTIAQLSPAVQYYDVVNVNRFTPDPRERLAVLTTFIRDPRNASLGLSRATKHEAGFELDGGARWGALGVTWFDDRIAGAVALRTDPIALERARYRLADTARGSGQPGRIVDPALSVEPIPVFLNRYGNGGSLGNRGVEFTATLPVIPALRTRLEISGAQIETRFATDERNYGSVSGINEFQVDSAIKRIAYFEGISTRSQRGVLTYRLVHHQPDLGLVITTTAQQRRGDVRETRSRTDATAFAGYVDRSGTLIPVIESARIAPQYADLRLQRPSVSPGRSVLPDDWVFALQVAKSLGRSGRLSFYVFNALDTFVTIGSGGSRSLPATRFGAELTLPTGELLGSIR